MIHFYVARKIGMQGKGEENTHPETGARILNEAGVLFSAAKKMVPFQQEGLKLDLQKDFPKESRNWTQTKGHEWGR